MACRNDHILLSKFFLGYSNPIIHVLIDRSVKYLGAGHRISNHSLQMLDGMELFFGKEGRREALLHLLTDAKIIDADSILKHIKETKKEKNVKLKNI